MAANQPQEEFIEDYYEDSREEDALTASTLSIVKENKADLMKLSTIK